MSWVENELLHLLLVGMLKEVDRWLLDFSNQYVKSHNNSEIVLMLKKIREMQDNQLKLQKATQEMQRQIVELSIKQSKINLTSTVTSSAAQVILMLIREASFELIRIDAVCYSVYNLLVLWGFKVD